MDFKDKRLMMSKEEVINRAKELLNENQEVLITKYMFLEQQCQKHKEVIDKAIDFIKNNGAKQYNHHDNYRGKWYSPDELDTILDILKEVE